MSHKGNISHTEFSLERFLCLYQSYCASALISHLFFIFEYVGLTLCGKSIWKTGSKLWVSKMGLNTCQDTPGSSMLRIQYSQMVVFVVNYSRQNSYINSLLDKLKFFWLTPSKTDEITIVFASLCGWCRACT